MLTPDSILRGAHGVFLFLTVMLCCQFAHGRECSERKYHDVPFTLNDARFDIPLHPDADSFVIDIRAAMSDIGERHGMARNYWGLDLIAGTDTLRLMLRHGNSDFGDIFDRRMNMLTLSCGDGLIASKDVTGFDSASGSYNTVQVKIDGQTIDVRGGGKRMDDIFGCAITLPVQSCSVTLWSKGELTVASLTTESFRSPQRELATDWDEQSLAAYLGESTDPVEGYWQYLDRENNPQYARLGGRYILAVVKNQGSGHYDIIYAGGAETLASEWHPMMLKGRLKPTIFLDHYDLEWIDSTFEPIKRDIHAQMNDGAILTFSFPLLKTTLRFSKMKLK